MNLEKEYKASVVKLNEDTGHVSSRTEASMWSVHHEEPGSITIWIPPRRKGESGTEVTFKSSDVFEIVSKSFDDYKYWLKNKLFGKD